MAKETKLVRAKRLDAAIAVAMKKFKFRVRPGVYLDSFSAGDICGCAVGAALASTAKTRPQLCALLGKLNYKAGPEVGLLAVEIVNDGITPGDLRNLEVGFELWSEGTAQGSGTFGRLPFSKSNPFYRLGRKLRKKYEESHSNS